MTNTKWKRVAAGLNVYATLATLGPLARARLLSLPSTLHLLSNWWIIAESRMMFGTEFFADKIPAFDLGCSGHQCVDNEPNA